MARAEVKAVVSADIHPLEKAFAEAKEKAKELGKQIGEVGNDLGKGLSGFDIGKMLGIGGAVYAAGKLGEALIDAAKEGYKAFQQYQDAVLKFKYNLPSSAGTLDERQKLGEEAAESSSKKAGAFTEDQLNAASLSLMQASKELRESPEKLNAMLDTVQALAIKTGRVPEEIAESLRRLNVGMKEEGGAAVGKFFKATPGLEDETEKLRDAHAQDYLKQQGVTQGSASDAQLAEFARLSKMEIGEFMSQETGRVGGAAVLEEIKGILERSAPKSIIAEQEGNHPEKMLAAAFEELHQAFGKELKPAIDDLVHVVMESMPTIKDDFMALADGLKAVIPIITFFGKILDGVNILVNTFVQTIANALAGPAWLNLDKTKNDAASVAAGVDKRLSQDGTSGAYTGGLYFGPESKTEPEKPTDDALEDAARKEGVKTAQEIARITAKTDADHLASQHQVAFEATQAAFQEKTRGAVRAAMSQVNPEDKSVAGREYGAQQEGAVKVTNIQATAAAKVRALNEESAQKIAKIQEEIGARAITRSTEDAEDKTQAQKDARATVRAAQDAASASAISDLQAEAAQKIRDENQNAADKIIDAQEASVKSQRDIIIAAYDEAVAKKEGPYKFTPDEGPAQPDTYSKFGKGGSIIEGSFERRQREEANRAGQEATDRANEAYQKQKEMSGLAGIKGGVRYDQSGVGAALNVNASSYNSKTGEKTDTSFEFSKGATEQAKTTLVLEAIYKALATLTGVLTA